MADAPKQLNVSADPKDLKGRYANAFAVTSQERDVVIDFISSVNTGGQQHASLVSRVFLNRFTADDLINVLQENKRRWEEMRYEGKKPAA
ncbi:MAG: DUF3467 domain-containing protein [Acidobacteria bacterium]|nr:DUF3467 domain-containing protein [Acidobacteriota bacterium]